VSADDEEVFNIFGPGVMRRTRGGAMELDSGRGGPVDLNREDLSPFSF